MSWWQSSLAFLFPDVSQVLHPRTDLIVLVWEHLRLVVISSTLTVLIGIPLGIIHRFNGGGVNHGLRTEGVEETLYPAVVLHVQRAKSRAPLDRRDIPVVGA